MQKRAELKESGERPGSLSVEALINCGPKQGGSGWLPMSTRRKQIASLACTEQPQGPGQAVSGRMQDSC